MSGYKFLREINEDVEIEILLEEVNGEFKKNYGIRGVFLMGEQRNRNGRIYPIKTLVREVTKYVDNYVKENRAYGELDHPDEPTVKLQRASHLITELKQDGNNFVGHAKILSTPVGMIARALMDDGCKLGVSSRGLGSLKETAQGKVVQDDLMLTTAGDLVSDPSAHLAWMENLREGAEWVMEAGKWVPQFREEAIEKIDEIVVESRLDRAVREEKFFKLFEAYLKKI